MWWGTAANVADVTQVDKVLHGEENLVSLDAAYVGVEKRPEHAGPKVSGRLRPGAAPIASMASAVVSCIG